MCKKGQKKRAVRALKESIVKWKKKEKFAQDRISNEPNDFDLLQSYDFDLLRRQFGLDIDICPLCIYFVCEECPLGIFYGICECNERGRFGMNAFQGYWNTWEDLARVSSKLIHQLEVSLKYVQKEW